jgi:hypothetical protein
MSVVPAVCAAADASLFPLCSGVSVPCLTSLQWRIRALFGLLLGPAFGSGVSVPCLSLFLAQLLAMVVLPCSWCSGVGGDCNNLWYYIM